MPKRTQLTDAEREQRRAADRAFVQQAVEALRSSEGWQRWLSTRRHFHSYSNAISGSACRSRDSSGLSSSRHVSDVARDVVAVGRGRDERAEFARDSCECVSAGFA